MVERSGRIRVWVLAHLLLLELRVAECEEGEKTDGVLQEGLHGEAC